MNEKVLITGEGSYIGNNLKHWLENKTEKIIVDKKSVRNDYWKQINYSLYDTVVHVAGVAHRKETKTNSHLYYEVNRDLTLKIAEKAKKEGVKHFVFLSSMSVYGNINGEIDTDTNTNPSSNYGKSKLQAENVVKGLESNDFKVAIIRPPMVYGRNCKGNYNSLSKKAKYLKFFPDVKNKRSMIYIDNLSEFLYFIIKFKETGTFFPQNSSFVSTSEMISQIGKVHHIKIKLFGFLNPVIILLTRFNKFFNKVFGDLYYEETLSNYRIDYNILDFEESIISTEGDDFDR